MQREQAAIRADWKPMRRFTSRARQRRDMDARAAAARSIGYTGPMHRSTEIRARERIRGPSIRQWAARRSDSKQTPQRVRQRDGTCFSFLFLPFSWFCLYTHARPHALQHFPPPYSTPPAPASKSSTCTTTFPTVWPDCSARTASGSCSIL